MHDAVLVRLEGKANIKSTGSWRRVSRFSPIYRLINTGLIRFSPMIACNGSDKSRNEVPDCLMSGNETVLRWGDTPPAGAWVLFA
jgi:hypothetical protein